MALRKTRVVGIHDQYVPHFAGLGWEELLAFWPTEDNLCYLVALDRRQISVLLSLLDQVAWCWWLWNVSSSDTEVGQGINDFTDELKDCLMSGCNVDELIAAVSSLTETIAACCRKSGESSGQDIDSPPHDGTVEIGPGNVFGDQEEYYSAKCSVANAIYDTILGFVSDIDQSDVDIIVSGVAGGSTAVMAAKIAGAGPLGWAISKVAMAMVQLVFMLIDVVVNFSDIESALGEQHEELVLALFNAENTDSARGAFMDALGEAETSLTASEITLTTTLLANSLLNQLFSPRADIIFYVSPDPIDCGATSALWYVAQGTATTPLDQITLTVESAYGSLSPFVPDHHGTYIHIPTGIGNRIVDITTLTGWTDNGVGPPTLTNAGYINENGVWVYAAAGVNPVTFIDNVCVKDGQYFDITSGSAFTVTVTYGSTCP